MNKQLSCMLSRADVRQDVVKYILHV